jgi:hypothetical protein
MQITLTLPDDLVGQLLQQLPDPDPFAREAIASAIQRPTKSVVATPASLSRWYKLAQRLRDHPISLGESAEPAKQDGQEFRENFHFGFEQT